MLKLRLKKQNYRNFCTCVTEKLCKLYANKCICVSIYIQVLNKEELPGLPRPVTETREFMPIILSWNPYLVEGAGEHF